MTDPNGEPESTQLITGQFLCFIGIMMSLGGALSIIRTGWRSLFLNALMIAGFAIWAYGKHLCVKARHDK